MASGSSAKAATVCQPPQTKTHNAVDRRIIPKTSRAFMSKFSGKLYLNRTVEEAGRAVFAEDEGLGAFAAAFEDEFIEFGIHGDRIFAVKAGHAETVLRLARGADHAFGVEVAERIGLEIILDLIVGKLVGDEVLGIGKIDAVVAGKTVGRTTDPDMNFLGAGIAEVHHAGAGGGAADDGIVDHDDALPSHAGLDDVQLHLDAEFPRKLRGVEECPADVVVADKGMVVGNLRFLAEAERGVVAGIGHGNDKIRLDRMKPGEFTAHVGPHRANVGAFEGAVGPREINVLENAEAEMLLADERLDGAKSLFVDDDDFARLDVADELRAGDDVEGARFAGEEPGVANFADAERPEAEGIAYADDFPFAHEDEGKRAANLAQGLDEAAVAEVESGLGHEVKDDLAVDGGFEDRAFGFEFGTQDVSVDEVAVVADGDLAAGAISNDGLGVFQRAGAGGGVADVADGPRAGKFGELVLVEDLGDEAHAVMAAKAAVQFAADHDAAAFLAAMLESVEAEESYFGSVGMAVDGEDAALILRPMLKYSFRRKRMIHARFSYTLSLHQEKGFAPRGGQWLGSGRFFSRLAWRPGSANFSRVKPELILSLPAQPVPFAVLGRPINHSLSPAMQQAAFDHCGIDARYFRVEVDEETLARAVESLRKVPFGGWNCTIPNKVKMVELCDRLDESARRLRAVNTVVNEKGQLVGHNTDGIGWSRALQEAFGRGAKDLRILLLGAGGASRAIAAQALLEKCPELMIANRNLLRAEELAGHLLQEFSTAFPVPKIRVVEWSTLELGVAEADLVVNVTAAGLDPKNPPVLGAKIIPPQTLIFDTLYGAASEKLRKEAEAAGARWSDGLGMLLHQGAAAFEIWTGHPAPLEIMREALRAAFSASRG
jgi:shikimate dehydrogenase